jgi:hypothetical protein
VKIEDRIRKAAASKVRVKITGRVRSKKGFIVNFPGGCCTVITKAEALQMLLAKVRCSNRLDFEITPRKSES